jgi:HSP20 family protein
VKNVSEEENKIKLSPFWCSCNQKVEGDDVCVEIELPGVKKGDIDLRMTDDSFTLSAPKEDIEYVGAWTWCCPVDSSKAKATYDNGLLTIEAPLETGPPSKKIKIQ